MFHIYCASGFLSYQYLSIEKDTSSLTWRCQNSGSLEVILASQNPSVERYETWSSIAVALVYASL